MVRRGGREGEGDTMMEMFVLGSNERVSCVLEDKEEGDEGRRGEEIGWPRMFGLG